MLKKTTKEEWHKGSLALLILVIIFSIFLLFYGFQASIIASNNLNQFIALTIIGSGLLFGLLYLLNNPQKHYPKKTKAKKSHK